MSKFGTSKVDRYGLTDKQYILALEISNETLADEVRRLREMLIASLNKKTKE